MRVFLPARSRAHSRARHRRRSQRRCARRTVAGDDRQSPPVDVFPRPRLVVERRPARQPAMAATAVQQYQRRAVRPQQRRQTRCQRHAYACLAGTNVLPALVCGGLPRAVGPPQRQRHFTSQQPTQRQEPSLARSPSSRRQVPAAGRQPQHKQPPKQRAKPKDSANNSSKGCLTKQGAPDSNGGRARSPRQCRCPPRPAS